jgi:hypothetical protein
MAAIALPAFHITTIRKHTVELPYALQQELEAYRAFYKQAYGADVGEADLIREIVRAFLAQDEGFRAARGGAVPRARSRSRSSRAGGAASEQNGVGGGGASNGVPAHASR